MVLSCLSLTTTPCNVRLGISKPLPGLGLRTRSALGLGCSLRVRRGLRDGPNAAAALLRGDGLDPRDVAAHLAHARRVLELARGALEAQVELLFLQLQDLVVELVDGHRPQIIG